MFPDRKSNAISNITVGKGGISRVGRDKVTPDLGKLRVQWVAYIVKYDGASRIEPRKHIAQILDGSLRLVVAIHRDQVEGGIRHLREQCRQGFVAVAVDEPNRPLVTHTYELITHKVSAGVLHAGVI